MPDFVAPQLCRLVDEPPAGPRWTHEVKFDGYRMQLRVEAGRAVLRTRRALDWSARFPEIASEGKNLPDCMLDGEICAIDARSVPSFAGLQEALSEGRTGGLIFFVFDLLFLDGVDLREQPLSSRKAQLKSLIDLYKDELAHYRYVDDFAADGKALLKSACEAGLEGIISKRLDAPYRSERSDLWTKEKCRGGQEVVIGGWWGGESKLRSILVGVYRGDDFHYLGRIGTGFNARNSAELLNVLKKLKRPTSPFTAGVKPPRAKEITWVEPEVVAEVEYATITRDLLLRQASYKAMREDKDARSVSLEQAMSRGGSVQGARTEKDMQEPLTAPSSPAAPATAPPKADNVVQGVTISNPDKILWPATATSGAYTKLDLARYYESVAARMLPHIALRPISLVRAPDGIAGQHFFQRHVHPGVGQAVPMKVAGEKQPYHAIDSIEGLVALAQGAVVEIHPWGCKKGDPEVPERLIFDLDPGPDLAFDDVILGATAMRDVLSAIGLEPFVKTTGGKGLHVVAAIRGTRGRSPTWDDAKTFALAVCERMEQASPHRYVTNMGKRHRGGKIFLDYLRNGRSATAVGPWSPRARQGATIALPLSWRDLKKGLDPKAFTIGTAGQFLKRADAWKDLAASAGSFEDAKKRLAKL